MSNDDQTSDSSFQRILCSTFQSAPAAISLLLLGAHFLRSANLFFIVPLILMLFLFTPFKLGLRIIQGTLFAGGLIWVNTTHIIYKARVGMEAPWGRMVLILSLVILLALVSIVLLEARIKTRKK